MDVSISKIICGLLFFLVSYPHVQGQVLFQRDFSPAEGLVNRYEKDLRNEICLNGYWDVQIIHVPAGWKSGSGIPPTLPGAVETEWEKTKIKIPSPINVNNWGGGQEVGEGTRFPYAPSSVYYPSYPKHWVNARMAWLRKSITIPEEWESKQVVLHFEAVAGECVVYVNGKEVYTHFDSFLPFEVNITSDITPGEKTEIMLGLRHSKLFDKHHPLYDKFGAVYPPGSNTDDLIGIWQDVYLFGLPEVRISDVFVKPWVDRHELELEVQITNDSKRNQAISVEGDIRKWINNNPSKDPLFAPEISWKLGRTSALKINKQKIELKPGEIKTIFLSTQVDNKLDTWSPESPNLYTLLLDIKRDKQTVDRKATRFGWRQFKIVGDEFHLNGSKIQCFGDIQHPFGPYVCSRRFAWAWYTMIKDFGGNAVRPHAQPWPRVYYDLADEMGLMVLDETALFGSSIRLNLEEEITWQRSVEHFHRLIRRDRNHPSVIGWSAGNEMFAIALLNKPEKSVSDGWDDKMVAMTLTAKEIDPTRDFITLDGDRDMNGRLPVWSKHFGHGLNLQDLPEDMNKPLIVGESGATYYGKPAQLYPFAGDKAFESYHGRSEALAVDLYQNVTKMARPNLAYFSPSEVSWFGIEHLGLGYNDYSRLPNLNDGVFAGKKYEEGKPGYQFERIPPYVSTFNPGLDPEKPLYKPLPMFKALKAAIAGEASPWDTYREFKYVEKPAVHDVQYGNALFLGDEKGVLYRQLEKIGVSLSEKPSQLLIIDAHTYRGGKDKLIEEVKKQGGTILLMLRNQDISPAIGKLLPEPVELTKREATALESNKQNAWGNHFDLPSLYFSEIKGDKHILKCGLAGDFTKKGEVILTAARTDWSLFNENPENRKCAQIVLYEQLEKPEGAALVSLKAGNTSYIVSALDYTISTEETLNFWRKLFPVMGVKLNPVSEWMNEESKKEHDLLMDGPVNGSLSQSVSFPEDTQKRGYYNRPYKRYEAESGKCFTTGLFLSPTSDQSELQSEASNSMATQLIEKDSYIQWKNEEAADGLVIRFSIPDGANGGGTKGIIALYVDDKFVANITLDSYWAWQHALKTGQTYPDNIPAENKFARMRFDDIRVKLAKRILRGATFKLVKVDKNHIPYTIDFVELEPIPSPVTYESITDQNKVSYHLSDGPLDQFIVNNEGKTIYIPAGKYDVYERIFIHKPHTKIIGAGMWYTEIYFASSADKAETYPKRGIQTDQDNILLDGLYITTANDRRYFVLPDGRNGGVGKGLMGSFGTNSTIRNVWIEHFECGGWITGTNHLTVQQSRFRNQYADGINLATGSKNSVVEYCSFRNNGDDDMASWSSGKNMCENITYRYCTAENNWRASSVGFFGGRGHKALNLLITDGMEAALRATTDFPGQPFSEEGTHLYDNISIYNCGAQEGPLGYRGDFMSGKTAGAIHLTSYGHYDLLNVQFSNIDIYHSRADAIYLDSGKDKMMKNIHFKNIHIKGTGRYGISFNHAVGEASYCNMVFENTASDNVGIIPREFKFRENEECPANLGPYHFGASGISRPVLENYLKRSVTMTEFLAVDPYTNDGPYPYKEDDVRLIKNTGVKFIGRAIYRWGREEVLTNPDYIEQAKKLAGEVHTYDQDVILQAALFEIITRNVEKIPIPSWAFEAMGVPAENRHFSYDLMLNPDGKFVNHWREGSSVPDITRQETQLWFIFLAGTYFNIGCEALHLGQTALMGMADPDLLQWQSFIDKLRRFAKTATRRGWVLLDAHVPHGGMIVDGVSLLDFNSFPLRIKEIPDKPQQALLEVGYLDALYNKSKGGTTPSGWHCRSLPYLVEFDNFGCSRTPGEATIDSHFIWGYDEITWFYLQNEVYRQAWLRYAYNWVRKNDPNGFLQMPVSRLVSLCEGKGRAKYRANNKSAGNPDGLNVEETIKELWNNE